MEWVTDSGKQLWSQLCLDASLTVTDSNKFSMSLSPRTSGCAGIRPPKGILTACIENICISFHFSTCRRTREYLRLPITVSGNNLQHTLTSTNLISNHLDRHNHSAHSSPGRPRDSTIDRYAPWALGTSTVHTSPLSSQDSVLSDTHSPPSLSVPASRHRYAIQDVSLDVLVRLVNASLRRLISDNKPPVRCAGILASSDPGSPKLAAISPALFSPGYGEVQFIVSFRNAANGLILGGLAACHASVYDSTYCVSCVPPHKFQR